MHKSLQRKLAGVVVSTKMQKTVVVRVDRVATHRKYQKQYFVSKSYKAHDEKNLCKEKDRVTIAESRPFSKEKHWRVIMINGRAYGTA